MDSKSWALFEIAKRQQGVVSYAQARSVGFTETAMACRRESREWVRVLPGVVRLYWAEDTWALRCRAAQLWIGPESRLSHLTAAQLLGFDVEASSTAHLTMGRRNRNRPQPWICFHLTTRVPSDEVEVSGLRVTTPTRTLLDLAAMLDEAELARVLRVEIRVGRVTTAALRQEMLRCPRRVGAAKLQGIFKALVRA